ncbi:hypothetical protein LGK98_10560 [Clostridium tagluense]|uniref:hypothetical protein n=1 Tax=Clostridium tagluense TaxID=360422 RepID=UPI001CF51856|nr:hypothetical protein [Clostridium tagluense]MCB2321269.1 hypothetical protein [Clostridium tagluense]MCB2335800.1 hypothetical protein [Clostridium tagluense]
MFRNRKEKKEKLRESEECLKLFNETVGNKTEEDGYNDSLDLYKEIKKYYKVKIKQKDFIIRVERIRLETITGKYSSSLSNYMISLTIAIMAALLAVLIQSVGLFNINISVLPEEINILLKIVTFLILLYVLINSLNDNISMKNKRESIINNIRLNVLIEIEKEIAQEDADDNIIDRRNIGNGQPKKVEQEVAISKHKSKKNNKYNNGSKKK